MGDAPNIVVDGAPRSGTVLTLSHWPGTPTPAQWRADLSTTSALLARRQLHHLPGEAEAVTVDHADEDAVCAVAALTFPSLTDEDADLLVAAARVGDFGVVQSRHGAAVSFALAAVLDPARTPVTTVAGGTLGGLAATGAMVGAALDLLPGLLDDVEAYRHLWEAEMAAYEAAGAAVADGRVMLREEPARDLVVVRPASKSWPTGIGWGDEPVHPAAVHSATSCMRVATADDDTVTVRFRYETWVRLGRRPRMLRVDLTPLAGELDAAEGAAPDVQQAPGSSAAARALALTGREHLAGRWQFDGAGALTPRLRWTGERPPSTRPDDVLRRLRRHLDDRISVPPAWDPYR